MASGCGGPPTIDASSDRALDASVKSISNSLTEDRNKQFAADCITLTMPALMKSAFQGGIGNAAAKPPSKLDVFKPLHGMTVDQVHAKALESRLEIASVGEKREAAEKVIKQDRDAIAAKAIGAMKKTSAENFGTAESLKARVTADVSAIKDFGEEKWEVTGLYEGGDRAGKEFRAPWTATIFYLGGLQCQSVELGEREYSERSAKAPPIQAGPIGTRSLAGAAASPVVSRPPPVPSPDVPEHVQLGRDRKDEIYRAVKAEVAKAKVKAAQRDLSTRKAVLARETDAAMARLQQKYGLTGEQLGQVVDEGEEADGTAAKRQAAALKQAVKAKNQAMLNGVKAGPPVVIPPPGLSAADRKAFLRATGVIPPAKPAVAPGADTPE